MGKKKTGPPRNRIKEFRYVDVSELQANPKNFRTHGEEQTKAMAAMLDRVGVCGAMIAYETTDGLQLIDGHLRKDLLIGTKAPVLILDVDDQEADEVLATFDPITAMAGRDDAIFQSLLEDIKFDDDDINAIFAEGDDEAEGGQVEVIEDDIEDLKPEPIVKPGELWLLGEHRLLCGDSAKSENVTRVMDGFKASCVFTDPPYGVSVGAKNRLLNSVQPSKRCLADIEDDDLKPEDLEAKLLPAFVNVRMIAMADDCTLMMTSPQCGELCMMMMMMMQKAGLSVRHVLIWKKNQSTFSMGRLDYDYQHEPILMTWGKRHKKIMNGKHQTSVWEVDKPQFSHDHPTMKPVELYANAYLNHTDEGDIVFDPYAGSGTCFIASEQLNRKCRGIEIDPHYCDVIIARWEKFTGKRAVLEMAI